MTNRDDLRTQMKMVQRNISSGDRRAATKALADVSESFLLSGGQKMVAGFYPVGDEITPLLLMQMLFRHQIQLALPKADENNVMRFHRWWPGDHLTTGLRGAPEPADDTDEVTPDYLIVPLLGFDAYGNRLGSGEGYYSRAISALKSRHPAVIVGVGFEEQELALPLDDDSEGRLDWIITPNGVRGMTH